MRRIFTTLISFVFVSLSLLAQDSLSIGYCMGECAKSGTIGREDKGEVSAAILIPREMLRKYVNNDLVAVRAGLTARVNIDSVVVWVRSNLDGENLAKGVIRKGGDPQIVRGWNLVTLKSALPITETTGDLYVGYTYYNRGVVYAVSVVGAGQPGSSFTNTQGVWNGLQQAGVLSIEALVVGDNLPMYDLGLSAVSIGPESTATDNTYYANMTVNNLALKDITGFGYRITRGDEMLATFQYSEPIERQRSKDIRITFESPSVIDPSDEVIFTITTLKDGEDIDSSNNSIIASFLFDRNVLVEEMTGEGCPNCPRVAGYMSIALEAKPEYADRVFAVCHHSYGKDWLSQGCDAPLNCLYNMDGSYFAPAVAINRSPYFTNRDGKQDNFFMPDNAKVLENYFDMEMEKPSQCTLSITATPNEDTTKVTLTIRGLKNVTFVTENKLLTVYVLENNIKAQAQAGATGQFVHDHVIRAYNSVWGDEIAWDGSGFTKEYTFDINKYGHPKSTVVKEVDPWKLNDLYFVAFISNYDEGNILNRAIENSASCKLIKGGSGGLSDVVSADSAVEIGRYALTGQQVGNDNKGICIVRYSDGSCKKVLLK